MLLEKFTESSVIQQTTPERNSLSLRVVSSNKKLTPYDKNIGKIYNSSDTYKKASHTLFKKKPIISVINRLMKENLSWLNQSSPPKVTRYQV